MPTTAAGIVPGWFYVIRKKGVVEHGFGACSEGHTRVTPDGSFVKGAQNNFQLAEGKIWRLRSAGAGLPAGALSPEVLKRRVCRINKGPGPRAVGSESGRVGTNHLRRGNCAKGFTIPETLRKREAIMDASVGTDPGLALETRRGTGLHKVPFLGGVRMRNASDTRARPQASRNGSFPQLNADYVPLVPWPDSRA